MFNFITVFVSFIKQIPFSIAITPLLRGATLSPLITDTNQGRESLQALFTLCFATPFPRAPCSAATIAARRGTGGYLRRRRRLSRMTSCATHTPRMKATR